MRTPRKAVYWLGALVALLVGAAPVMAQQTGTIAGIVRSDAGQPVAGAQVSVVGTTLGTITQENGRYLIREVPAGTHDVRVELIGYAAATREVNVQAGETVTVNFAIESEAIALEEIIVTGVSGATIKAKVPFEVGTVTAGELPVPSVSAASAIQGKIAGATVVNSSGQPGSAPTILLRGPTSINASGRSQDPLYIVDGVILGASTVDIDALDIDNIEVVKGAAAASLYGSRAANGVINITTKRGQSVPDDEVMYTLRTEYGQSEIGNTPDVLLAQYHRYELTDDGSAFVTQTGEPCQWLECPSLRDAGPDGWSTFQVQEYPGQTYDHLDYIFENGVFNQNYISAAGRSGTTNFHISFSNLKDEGIFPGLRAFDRNNFRINVDQSVMENFAISASAFYSRSTNNPFSENTAGPLFALTRQPAAVSLLGCEDDLDGNCLNDPENIILQTEPGDLENPNPLYDLLVTDDVIRRGRFLGSGNLRWSPVAWFDVDANASYDRLDYNSEYYTPTGYRTLQASPTAEQGNLYEYFSRNEALNASLTGTFRFSLAENIDNRTQLRYLYEEQEDFYSDIYGYQFAATGVPTFGNIDPETLDAGSGSFPIRADGYFAITNFDIFDRYIIDALVRNDGSSLFGENERRQWYYRLAGAWRVAQEPWFDVTAIDEMKLRYSYGTAGGRPSFEAQYETFSVGAGSIRPVTLGNADLKPEFSREQEVGVDASFFAGRVQGGVTYANTVTEDQILQVPLFSYSGYTNQWQNAGTLESNTWEASVDVRLLDSQDFQWQAGLVWDRTRSEITELNVPAFTYGFGDQGLEEIYYAREGEELGTFYGIDLADDVSDLPADVPADQFMRNDEGLLVWVGEGGSLNDPQWGTQAPFTINGKNVMWGAAVAAECETPEGNPTFFCSVGNSLPDYSVGISSSVNWRGLSLYGLLGAEQGFDVFNLPLMWANFEQTAGLYDQGDVPEGDRKPINYFYNLYEVSGLNQPNSYFVEDGSYWKLRELALRYRVGSELIGAMPGIARLDGVTLSLIGRNLLTWTDYRGFDPEVGKSGSTSGSAALARVEGYTYPQFRTWTLGVELNF